MLTDKKLCFMKTKLQLIIAFFLLDISSFAQVQNNGDLKIHNGASIGFFGDFTNHGIMTNNLGEVHVVGGNTQTFNGSSLIHTNNFIINKNGNSLKLDNELQIAGALTFIKGKILSDRMDTITEFVHFLDGAIHTGASDSSHIDGVIRKTGAEAFVFPTGNNDYLRIIGISAPENITDYFTAFYKAIPDTIYDKNALDSGLNHISDCEYWGLTNTGSSSNVEVNLSWGLNSCGVTNLCELQVARWNGTYWTSEGNGGVSGNTSLGTIASGSNCSTPLAISNFGPFTLGSISSNNPLPIKLLSFQAKKCDNETCLSWKTASEINNDYFTVEKSLDGLTWEELLTMNGAGNSSVVIDYDAIDENPFLGTSLYRLKQTDFNGQYSYSEIRTVAHGNSNIKISAFPNPANNQLTINGEPSEIKDFIIYNSWGQNITSSIQIISNHESIVKINITSLPSGFYTLITKSGSSAIKFAKI